MMMMSLVKVLIMMMNGLNLLLSIPRYPVDPHNVRHVFALQLQRHRRHQLPNGHSEQCVHFSLE